MGDREAVASFWRIETTSYIFKEYGDNLDDNKLATGSSRRLFNVAISCEGLCEVCRHYFEVLQDRLEELEKENEKLKKRKQ